MVDQYELALGHLHAAMAAMVARRNTLAAAVIAQAVSVVEQGAAENTSDESDPSATLPPPANHRPC